MRLGFFGGTFDPPHLGHTAIALAAADAFALEAVLWTPAGRQPLKVPRLAAPFTDRMAMTSLACAEDARFQLSDADAPRPDETANYMVDTLRSLNKARPGVRIFCIAGADSFADLRLWKEPEALLELADWVVISRPGFVLTEPRGMILNAAQRERVHLLDAVQEDVSATGLRERLAAGDDCRDLLADGVAAYIREHGLYGSTGERSRRVP